MLFANVARFQGSILTSSRALVHKLLEIGGGFILHQAVTNRP